MSEGDGGGSFEDRLRTARSQRGLDKPPASTEGDPSPWGIGARVGVDLVAALAVGLGIGWALDHWLGTTPWLLALFVLLGGAAGIMNVWRTMGPGR